MYKTLFCKALRNATKVLMIVCRPHVSGYLDSFGILNRYEIKRAESRRFLPPSL